jgi:hypothetical protein
MSLISGGGLHGGFQQHLSDLEDSTNAFANSLARKDNVSLQDMFQLKDRLQSLEQKSEIHNAVVSTIHRIIMSIIHSMKH